jgi:hypothetical protein
VTETEPARDDADHAGQTDVAKTHAFGDRNVQDVKAEKSRRPADGGPTERTPLVIDGRRRSRIRE